MQTPLLEPSPSGVAPGRTRTAVGHDDQCAWHDSRGVRCTEPATDTVKGQLYCSPHADRAAGI